MATVVILDRILGQKSHQLCKTAFGLAGTFEYGLKDHLVLATQNEGYGPVAYAFGS